MLGGAGCGTALRRPDLIFVRADEVPETVTKSSALVNGRIVCVEIDEHSHQDRTSECESGKIWDQTVALKRLCGETTRIFVVRFNPDEFDGARTSLNARIAAVGAHVKWLLEEGWRMFENAAVPHVSFHYYHSKCAFHIDYIRNHPESFNLYDFETYSSYLKIDNQADHNSIGSNTQCNNYDAGRNLENGMSEFISSNVIFGNNEIDASLKRRRMTLDERDSLYKRPRWDAAEISAFDEAFARYGRDPVRIAAVIGTRTPQQVARRLSYAVPTLKPLPEKYTRLIAAVAADEAEKKNDDNADKPANQDDDDEPPRRRRVSSKKRLEEMLAQQQQFMEDLRRVPAQQQKFMEDLRRAHAQQQQFMDDLRRAYAQQQKFMEDLQRAHTANIATAAQLSNMVQELKTNLGK